MKGIGIWNDMDVMPPTNSKTEGCVVLPNRRKLAGVRKDKRKMTAKKALNESIRFQIDTQPL